jgi:hypothetical protein
MSPDQELEVPFDALEVRRIQASVAERGAGRS